MNNSTFVGMGHNPDEPDVPAGLGMRIAQEPQAMATFGALSNTQKTNLINHVRGAATGPEARSRVMDAVAGLKEGRQDW